MKRILSTALAAALILQICLSGEPAFTALAAQPSDQTGSSSDAGLKLAASDAKGITITKDTENITVEMYQNAVYHIEASGNGLQYQWQLYDPSVTKWLNVSSDYLGSISGENTDTFSFRAAPQLENRYPIRCVVTDSAGAVARSTPATLSLLVSQRQ